MRIRKMQEADIGQMVKLIHNVMGTLDAKKAYHDMKVSLSIEKLSPYKFEEFFVMEIENDIVAVGEIWALNYEPIAHLGWFVVDAKHQRKGFGSMLLRHCEEVLKKRKISIITAETSGGRDYKPAVSFYLHNGFKIVAEIPKYWEDGTSWVYFMKRLDK